jgi:nucleoside diphosphate kinase
MKNPYQIIIAKDNKQVEYVGCYHTLNKATTAFAKLQKECENVVFPIMHTNMGRSIKETKYELVIIKRKEVDESKTTLLRNNYGEFVEHETTYDEWVVFDKAPYYVEETFWVYGYHPLVQRKTFQFIFDTIVKPNATTKDSFLNVFVYLNKIVMETTNKTELITCKNKSDAIRFYNKLEEMSQKHKLKYIIFSGNWSLTNARRKEAVEKIQKLTNWNLLKIKRNNTRP